MGPSWDAALWDPLQTKTLEGWPDESWDHNMKFFSLEISANTKPLTDSFLKKLWEILSSQSRVNLVGQQWQLHCDWRKVPQEGSAGQEGATEDL